VPLFYALVVSSNNKIVCVCSSIFLYFFFFSSRRRHTRSKRDWSSDVCSSDLVPAVGAGTANTEFETITGMSLRYFGPGEYPYKSILKETTCESAPYVLKDLGYSTHAIHNNEANFYGRRTIFPNLGFDSFTSEEYMPEEDDKNALGWVKDEVLTNHI